MQVPIMWFNPETPVGADSSRPPPIYRLAGAIQLFDHFVQQYYRAPGLSFPKNKSNPLYHTSGIKEGLYQPIGYLDAW